MCIKRVPSQLPQGRFQVDMPDEVFGSTDVYNEMSIIDNIDREETDLITPLMKWAQTQQQALADFRKKCDGILIRPLQILFQSSTNQRNFPTTYSKALYTLSIREIVEETLRIIGLSL